MKNSVVNIGNGGEEGRRGMREGKEKGERSKGEGREERRRRERGAKEKDERSEGEG